MKIAKDSCAFCGDKKKIYKGIICSYSIEKTNNIPIIFVICSTLRIKVFCYCTELV